jgi:hypothetical protein
MSRYDKSYGGGRKMEMINITEAVASAAAAAISYYIISGL